MRLWSLAEAWGGMEINYKFIARQMGELEVTPQEAEKFCKKLVRMGKLFPYTVDKKRFYWVRTLHKHQELRRIHPPKLPLPEWISVEIKDWPSGKKYGIFTINYDPMERQKKTSRTVPDASRKPSRNGNTKQYNTNTNTNTNTNNQNQ
jgi:hypothetical protein